MTRIGVYDDTEKVIEQIADVLDVSTCEVVDFLLDNLDQEIVDDLKHKGVKFL